ncbi:MAG: helix-turn-helix domain-containing protein [Tissierellia bacterium]|nr:helix-turn-helix domain-containing protein [Tissierellia bacterium]
MRREIPIYLPDLPVGIRLLNIKNTPFSWRKSIQLLQVLEGSLGVTVENESYSLHAGQVDIINEDEVYSFKSDEDNVILLIDIDPNFFEKFYDDAREVFYYADETASGEEEKYIGLKKLIDIIYYECLKKYDDYEEKIEEKTLELMYYLLNNFHYLYYEGEGVEWNEETFNRSHRIVKYISNNYMDKVSLQDIADQEFLTSQYLSFKIKDTFGQTFNEYVSQMRVEESTKLLLDTDKSIQEIAEDIGFSHSRYYNKHFKLNYNMTPLQYRKKYKMNKKEYEALRQYEDLDLERAEDFIYRFIEDYERYEYDNRIIKIDLDLSGESIGEYRKPTIIDLGDIYLLLEQENRNILSEVLREIEPEYGVIRRLFSEDMDVYRGGGHRLINWTRVENVLEYLDEIELKPIIMKEGIEDNILQDFLEYFHGSFPDIGDCLRDDLSDFEIINMKSNMNPYYDRIEMASFAIKKHLEEGKTILFEMIDEVSRDIILENETFFGGKGLFTSNYLKKPSYYAWLLLSTLGDEIIKAGEGYFVTKSEGEYQILLYNAKELSEDSPKKTLEKRYSINMRNMEKDFQITRYELNSKKGSVYDKWLGLNSPVRLDDDSWELLSEYVHPEVEFEYMVKRPISNLYAEIPPYGVALFVLSEYE